MATSALKIPKNWRVLLLVLVVLALIVTAVRVRNILVHGYFNKDIIAFSAESARLEDTIDHYRNQAQIISSLPVTREFAVLAAQDNDYLEQRKNLEQTILEIFFNDPAFYQVRYLDRAGQEIIKINRDDGGIHFSDENQLYSKKDNQFFKDGINLKRQEVSTTDIALTTEGPQIHLPHEATIRFVAPVYDTSTNTPIGIVVINIKASEIFKRFQKYFGNNLMVFNEKGIYLIHSDKTKLFGDQLKTNISHFELYPNDLKKLTEGGDEVNNNFNVFSYRIWKKFFYNPKDTSKFWIITTQNPQKNLN